MTPPQDTPGREPDRVRPTPRVGRPQVSSRPGPPSSGKLTGASKVLSSDESCVARPFALISRASLYVRHTSGSFMHFSLCSLVFSPVFQLWVPADHNSLKLVEMIRVKLPTSRFWWFIALNDAEVGGHIFNLRYVNKCRSRQQPNQKQL